MRPSVAFRVVAWAGLLAWAISAGWAQDNVTQTVEARPLSELAIYPQYKAPATVIALNDSEISAQVSAVVDDIAVQVGQVVARGDLLVALEKQDFQLALKQERAELDILQARIEFAEYQVQRAQKLQQQQAVSEELLKQRETDLAVLVAQKQSRTIAVQQARLNLSKCEIRAPFNAVITRKLVSIGELANPGTSLLRVVDAQRREVTANLQSYQVASLRAAAQLYFQDRGQRYPLTVRSVLPVIDPQQRTRDVRLLFTDTKALAGSAGELVWKSNDVHVPAELLVQRNEELGIFIVNKDRAKFMVLEDAAEGRPARVDVPMDTLIVTKGRFRLQDGDAVTVM